MAALKPLIYIKYNLFFYLLGNFHIGIPFILNCRIMYTIIVKKIYK